MNLVNKVELQLKDFEKCHTIVHNDCPLGELFDYASALQSFVLAKMKEAKESIDAQNAKENPKAEEIKE